MAGHSKFKNIMHRKGAQDKKRAKIFTKLGREIQVAAKSGGGDPDMNPRLRLAIQAAKSQSMPKDNIERAINKGVGGGSDADNFEEMRYEGYGPGGTSVIVEALTDNRNRTASEVRAAFSKNGGNLGETGSVGFNFERVGRISYPLDAGDADHIFEQALEAGAEDVSTSEEEHEIFCAPDDLNDVRLALESNLGEANECALSWKPLITIELDEDKAQSMVKLIDALEDNDDVQNVTANFEISDEIMAKLAG